VLSYREKDGSKADDATSSSTEVVSISSREADPTNEIEITALLVRAMTSAGLAAAVLDNIQVRQLFQKLRYKLPSSTTYKRVLLRTYCARLMDDLRKSCQTDVISAGFTTDLWSAHGLSYITIVCHAIDRDFTRRTLHIGTFPIFADKQSSDVIESFLFKKINKIFRNCFPCLPMTTDGGSNVCNAATEHPDRYTHFRCVNHILHNIVDPVFTSKEKGVPGIISLFEKVKKVATYCKFSTKATTALIKSQLGSSSSAYDMQDDSDIDVFPSTKKVKRVQHYVQTR